MRRRRWVPLGVLDTRLSFFAVHDSRTGIVRDGVKCPGWNPVIFIFESGGDKSDPFFLSHVGQFIGDLAGKPSTSAEGWFTIGFRGVRLKRFLGGSAHGGRAWRTMGLGLPGWGGI
ncbi:hypothetical protein KEJ44_03585 [Candidatus Bathyarchaeota archaeon]|nr:hypothetical protein [Candidatus Bathyarchaeota archaeon]